MLDFLFENIILILNVLDFLFKNIILVRNMLYSFFLFVTCYCIFLIFCKLFYRWVAASPGGQIPLPGLWRDVEPRGRQPIRIRLPAGVRWVLLRPGLWRHLQGARRQLWSLHVWQKWGEDLPAWLGEGPGTRGILHKTWVPIQYLKKLLKFRISTYYTVHMRIRIRTLHR